MASSRVMPSASTSARTEQTSLYSVGHMADLPGDNRAESLGSMNMEELLRNFYAETPAGGPPTGEIADAAAGPGEKGGEIGGVGLVAEVAPPPRQERRKTVEEVWKEISRERKEDVGAKPVFKEETLEEITLEAFLAREGAVTEEEVRAAPIAVPAELEVPVPGFVMDHGMVDQYTPQPEQMDGPIAGFASGVENGVRGKGKRKALEDPEDRAAQQRQRRMIKNRESAARSRERKQAYILELETLVTRLEDENARIARELEEQEKTRLKQNSFLWLTESQTSKPAH